MKVIHVECPQERSVPCPDATHWIVSLDRSGSMADICRDGKTKLEHVIHGMAGLTAAIREAAGGDADTHTLTLIPFDHVSSPAALCVPLSTRDGRDACDATLSKLLANLTPRGSTDIGGALQSVSVVSAKLRRAAEDGHRSVRINHIFLTDGEPTKGVISPSQLKALVEEGDDIRHVFLGFGRVHNSALLSKLAERHGSLHYFVDSLEKAGMLLGEVVYRLTHEIVPSLLLRLPEGKLFDDTKQAWVEEIDTGMLSDGDTRTYLATDALSAPIPISAPEIKVWWTDDPGDVQRHEDRKAVQGLCYLASYQTTGTVGGSRCARACDLIDRAAARDWDGVMAVLAGEPGLVQAWPTMKDMSVLHHALKQGRRDLAERVLEMGADLVPTRSGVACHSLMPDPPTVNGKDSRTLKEDLSNMMSAMRKKAEEAERDVETIANSGWYSQLADDAYIALLSLDNPVGDMFITARRLSHRENRAYNTKAVGELESMSMFRGLHQVSHADSTPVASLGALRSLSTARDASDESRKRVRS